jgi:hypothetical protein
MFSDWETISFAKLITNSKLGYFFTPWKIINLESKIIYYAIIKLKKQISYKNNFKMKLKKINYQKNSKHKKEIKILLQQKNVLWGGDSKNNLQ